jgi:hypothetical protein
MNISCREASRLMSQAQDRELSLGERVRLRVHLAICRGCRAFNAQLAFLRRAVRRLGDEDRGDQPL